jgi:putative MATE family efflux protein
MSDTSSNILQSRAFTDRMFRRFFLPTLFSAIGWALGDVADALFVGIRLGKVGLATMSLVAPVYMVYNVLDVGIALGTSVKYTQALGKGKAKKGVEIFSQMLIVALVVSILIGATGLLTMPYILHFLGAGSPRGELWNYTKEYLQIMFLGAPITFLYFLLYYCVRCDDAEKLASAGYTIGYLTDVVASAVFIMGFKLDVKGAIYATVLGKAVGVCIFLFHFTRKWAILRFRLVKPDFKLIFSILKTGMSSSVGYIGQFIALIAVNNILQHMGGEGALAQLNVVQNVSYLSLAIYTALGDTVQPLSGTFFAEHNKEAIKRVMYLGLGLGIAFGIIISALFAVFAPNVCSLFGLRNSAIQTGSFAVRLFCLSVIPAGVNIIWSACFQAIKREKMVFLINQLRTFICFLAFALVLSRFEIKWFWFSFLGAELLTIIIWGPIAYFKKQQVSNKVLTYLLDVNSSDLSDMLSKAEEFCEANDINMKQSYTIVMCIEEVCQAITENAFNKKGSEYIMLTLCIENNGSIILHFRDNAATFNPFAMKMGKNYDDDENLASLGIQMVKNKSKQFFYRKYSGFNTLTVEVE